MDNKLKKIRGIVEYAYNNAYKRWNPDGAKVLRCELLTIMNEIDSLLAKDNKEDLETEIEEYAYTLPHSSTGIGPNLKHYDDPSVKEARSNGWKHEWSYDNVVNIVKHFAL